MSRLTGTTSYISGVAAAIHFTSVSVGTSPAVNAGKPSRPVLQRTYAAPPLAADPAGVDADIRGGRFLLGAADGSVEYIDLTDPMHPATTALVDTLPAGLTATHVDSENLRMGAAFVLMQSADLVTTQTLRVYDVSDKDALDAAPADHAWPFAAEPVLGGDSLRGMQLDRVNNKMYLWSTARVWRYTLDPNDPKAAPVYDDVLTNAVTVSTTAGPVAATATIASVNVDEGPYQYDRPAIYVGVSVPAQSNGKASRTGKYNLVYLASAAAFSLAAASMVDLDAGRNTTTQPIQAGHGGRTGSANLRRDNLPEEAILGVATGLDAAGVSFGGVVTNRRFFRWDQPAGDPVGNLGDTTASVRVLPLPALYFADASGTPKRLKIAGTQQNRTNDLNDMIVNAFAYDGSRFYLALENSTTTSKAAYLWSIDPKVSLDETNSNPAQEPFAVTGADGRNESPSLFTQNGLGPVAIPVPAYDADFQRVLHVQVCGIYLYMVTRYGAANPDRTPPVLVWSLDSSAVVGTIQAKTIFADTKNVNSALLDLERKTDSITTALANAPTTDPDPKISLLGSDSSSTNHSFRYVKGKNGVTVTEADNVIAISSAIVGFKEEVRAGSFKQDLGGWVPAGSGATKTLTAPAVGVVTLNDNGGGGVALAAGDRVLVKGRATQASTWTVPPGDDAGWADQDYLLLVGASGTRHVYFTLDGSGAADPAPAGSTPVGAVDIDTATPDTGAQVADKIRLVVGADAEFGVDAAGSATLVVTAAGLVEAAAAPAAATSPLALVSTANDETHNGIYFVSTEGTAGAAGVLTRAADADGNPAGEVAAGDFVTVTEGDTLANTGWVLQGSGDLVVDTDAQVWVQFIGATQLAAGAGIDITDNIVSITTLGAHTDVTLTAPAAGDLLARNAGNTAWVNRTPAAAGLVSDNYARTVVAGGSYAALETDQVIAVQYTPTGPVTITLPQIAALTVANKRKRLTIVDEGGNAEANNITITANATDSIIGSAGGGSFLLDGDYNSVSIYSDGGTGWFIG